MKLTKDQAVTPCTDSCADAAVQPSSARRGTWGWRAIESFGYIDAADTAESHRAGCKERYKHISLRERLAGGLLAMCASDAWSWRDADGGRPHTIADSYMLINVSAKSIAYYAIEYGKRGFIHCYDENGWIIGDYWELTDPDRPYDKATNPYIIKDECEVCPDTTCAAADRIIAGRLFECRLPVAELDYVNDKIIANLATIDEIPEGHAYAIAKHGVGMSAYGYRCRAYRGLLDMIDTPPTLR